MAKSRSFALELYPEDEEHVKVLEYIKQYFEYAYILHDKDRWEEETEDHHVGELKKPHYHVVINFKNARSIDKLKIELGLKHIETCNFYYYIRYLIHKDQPKKYQYSELEIFTNMELRVMNALKRDYNSQEQNTRLILDFILDKQHYSFCTLMDVTNFAMQNDCLLDLKKNINFYSRFLDETGGFRRF